MLRPSKNKKEPSIEERYILSIDGGGMRGIIPAIIVSKLNEKLKELNEEKPFYSFFDLITGTSTGGLIALGLSTSPLISNLQKEEGDDILKTYENEPLSFLDKLKGKKPKENKSPKLITRGSEPSSLKDFYVNDGKSIFHSDAKFFTNILKDKYNPRYFENFLYRTFQNAKMHQCLVPTMVVSYDIAEGNLYNFKSWEGLNYYVREAARATSAAPMYFPPCMLIDTDTHKKRFLIDGGIIANNPVLLAYSEARKLYPNCKKFHILSLSTATNEFSMEDEDINGGLMTWIDPSRGAPIQKIASTSQMQLAAYVSQNISDLDFTRIHYNLKGDSFKLDDTSTYAINTLIDSGEQLFRKEEEKLTAFIKKMIKREDFSHILDIDKLKISNNEDQEMPLQLEEYKEETIKEEENTENNKKRFSFYKKNNNSNISFDNNDLKSIIKEKDIKPIEIEEKPNEKFQEILDRYGLNEEDLK